MNIAELIVALHSNTLFPIRKIAKDYSISSSQLLCLVSIPSEGINQTNLASLLSIDLSTLSRNLQHLVNKNFIIKQRIKSDNRSYHIFLSDNGTRLCQKVYEDLESYFHDIHLLLNDQEIEQILSTLSQFNWMLFKKKLDNAHL
tara:strand:- start:16 stop:447 length:432 start_codon:yes stop_codon:yes gene_type:complete